MNPYRRVFRHLEYSIAAGYNLLGLVDKGKDVEAKDVAITSAITAAQIAAIYYTDKLVYHFVTKGYVALATRAIVTVQLVYIGGAIASAVIDPDKGFQRYNEFIDDVVSGDIGDAGNKINFSVIAAITAASKTQRGKTAIMVLEEGKRMLNPF